MARKHWKQHERDAARLFGGRRHPANQGGPVDVTGPVALVQCKEVRLLALPALERLAASMATIGLGHMAGDPMTSDYRSDPKAGVVVVKRSAGRGVRTSSLVVMTAETFARYYRRDEEGGRDARYVFTSDKRRQKA